MRQVLFVMLLFFLFACSGPVKQNNSSAESSQQPVSTPDISLIVLGNVQDAGSPQIGCTKACCQSLFVNPDKARMVVSLGIIDNKNKKNYLLEATPDIARQVKILRQYSTFSNKETPDGIFLTHAHIGHYAGLMYLGKEAMNADRVPVYAMPRMHSFLENNGPWSQLVTNSNIVLQAITADRSLSLTPDLSITPFTVPHRDEFSETVGYSIAGPNKKAIFIPDIDKWEKWERDITAELKNVDYALIDATFFDAEEINNRDISTIPHPFVSESMDRFSRLPPSDKEKIYFIHFNHTNPLLDSNSRQSRRVTDSGYNVAGLHCRLAL